MDIQAIRQFFDSLNVPQLTRYLAGLTVYVAVAQHASFSRAASFRASAGVPRSASRIFREGANHKNVDSRSPDRSPVSLTDNAVYPTASPHVVFI